MRCATVLSGTNRARPISAVVSPPMARSVSATWLTAVSDGWQQSRNSARLSSAAGTGSAGSVPRVATVSSRRRRAASARSCSMRRRAATVVSQAAGLSGASPGDAPSRSHVRAAARSASCTASSQASKSP